jgi:Flp pilus assembly protein TadG
MPTSRSERSLRPAQDRFPAHDRFRHQFPVPVPGRDRRGGADAKACRGAVTAEFAVALPAVLLVLGLLLAGSAAGLTQLRLEEAARAGARALARGEDPAAVGGIVRRLAGESARASVASDAGWLTVTVSGPVHGAAAPLVPWILTARAWARAESTDAPAGAVVGTPSVGRIRSA